MTVHITPSGVFQVIGVLAVAAVTVYVVVGVVALLLFFHD